MAYLVLARKWRPQRFEDVVGQPHVIRTLMGAIRQKRVAHAYLFSGARGVGKTTVARLLAKALNCLEGPTPAPCGTCDPCREIAQGRCMDVVEIDGASNTSVDDVRELREAVKYAPSRGRYKVYIIDEVHMLSTSAFNALLKTLEEPPAHVVFVFATTEVHKIPATILSRCQHYAFRRLTRREIADRLGALAQQEGIAIQEPALGLIAAAADGSLRDAQSLLDQAVAYAGTEIRENALAELLGLVAPEVPRRFAAALKDRDAAACLDLIAAVVEQGQDPRRVCGAVVEHLRDLLVLRVAKNPEGLVEETGQELQALVEEAQGFPLEDLQRFFQIFAKAEEELRGSPHPRYLLEAAAVRACQLPPVQSLQELVEGIHRLLGQTEETPPLPAPDPADAAAGAPQTAPAADRPARAEEAMAPQTGISRPVEDSGLRSRWLEIVQAVKKKKSHVGSYLEQGVLVEFTAERLTLGYRESQAFLLPSIQRPENQAVILAEVASRTGVRPALQVVTLNGEEQAQPTLAEEMQAREARRRNRLREAALADPMVQTTLSIFRGKLLDVRPIEGLAEQTS